MKLLWYFRDKSLRYINWLAPLVLGAFAFLVIAGPRVLYPTNISWLCRGDAAQHYLGWVFFRNSKLTFPLGLNPDFGMDFANSVVYSDSIPLLAIPFKLISSLLPEPFQYFGLWIFICFVLQAHFGWKLAGLMTESRAVSFLFTGFLVFSPPMIWRLHAHTSLASHFLILAALYLVLCQKGENRWRAWGLLLATTALVHAYLLALVAMLWMVDLLERKLKKEITTGNFLVEPIVMLTVLGVVCWQAGYFIIGSGVSTGGYGYYRMNLLSIVDSDGWSNFLTDLPGGKGDYEGFNFLGAGGLLLLATSLICVLRLPAKIHGLVKTRPVLIAALAATTLFSLSNNVGIATFNLEYPLPELLVNKFAVFRSSGRMFWVVYYLILCASMAIIITSLERRFVLLLLACALIIQVADTRSGWEWVSIRLKAKPGSEWLSTLVDPFWSGAARQYKKVKLLMPSNYSPRWKDLSYFAANNGLATDAVYLARIDKEKFDATRVSGNLCLTTGIYERDTLYVLDDEAVDEAMKTIDTDRDLFAKIDGLNVLAPWWNTRKK